jgi:peptidoglycan/xylan/chitin deacetylase (PgdA/CDA1 family)
MNQRVARLGSEAARYFVRARERFALEGARVLARRELAIHTPVPLISFTFDDFPRSAFLEAGSILTRYGARGTYYASLGLMEKQSQMGPMYQTEDLKELVRLGHELGCHTFRHCHSWNTPADVYERAIVENQKVLTQVLPGITFKTFAYPFSAPHLGVKRVASRHFACCRGGGLSVRRYFPQAGGRTFNSGVTDLNLLCAVFLEQSRDNPEALKSLIDQNAQARGWLILATHDVCDTPSRFGCTPAFFEQVVQWCLESGARILPVVESLEVLKASQPEQERKLRSCEAERLIEQ